MYRGENAKSMSDRRITLTYIFILRGSYINRYVYKIQTIKTAYMGIIYPYDCYHACNECNHAWNENLHTWR